MRALLLLMQLAVAQPQPSSQPQAQPRAQPLSRRDSTRLRARTDAAIHEFLNVWTVAWMETQHRRPAMVPGEGYADDDERSMALHCHWDEGKWWLRKHLIPGALPAQSVCPRFLPPDSSVADERRSIDNGLAPSYRWSMRVDRARMRLALDSAAQLLPHDIQLAGQRVRFALDAGDMQGAARAALTCDYAPVECGLLQGLILYRVGAVASADSAFEVAARRMTPEQRCSWTGIGVLLDPEIRGKYDRMSCADRTAFEARFWWLSDPLWIEPGNERRAEHFARKVEIRLLIPLRDDGRQHFTPGQGGDAVIESLLRYGWPSQFFWGGRDLDLSHGTWLAARGAEVAPPYVVREYTRAGRLHTVPAPSALESPFTATRDSWQLTAPNGDDDWWPRSHYARDRGAITELPVGQAEMLRRGDSTRFVWAGELDSAARGQTTDTTRRASLFESRSIDSVRNVASFALRRGTEVIVDAPLAPGRALVGVEVPGDNTHAAARSRYAIEIAPPLTALHGTRAVSEALLFEPDDDAPSRMEPEQAVERMSPTTTFRHARRIGVYWEGYGFSPADTLDLMVRVTKKDDPNAFMRAMHALGVGGASGYEVAVRWHEVPGSSAAIQHTDSGIPFQCRSIVLDVSKLEPGKYVLQIGMGRPGEAAVMSTRPLELR